MHNGLDTWKEQQLHAPLNSSEDEQRRRKPDYGVRKSTTPRIIAAATITVLLSGLIATTTVLAVTNTEPCSRDVDIPSCPNGWVGYRRHCYFFSEGESNWTISQSHCSSLGASLTGVTNDLEMAFLLRYKGSLHHWIGLRRDLDESWKWPNSTEFDKQFEIRGGGDCAYLNHVGLSSSSCGTEKNWICVKPEHYLKQK